MNKYCKPLIDFISQHVSLSKQEEQELCELSSVKQYRKGDLLIKEGQVSKYLQFVFSGIYRVYEIREGKEITTYFNTSDRNRFVANFVSLLTQQPSLHRIECIVPGELLSIDYKDWQVMYEKSHALTSFGRIMAEFNYVLAMERIESLQYQSATDRYLKFLKHYPLLMNQIPQHYIASYLGITPESMSRIRKDILKNN